MAHELAPHHLSTIDELERLCAAARAALPSEPVPCFARLGIEMGGHRRDVLLGVRTAHKRHVSVVNWQTAPLAEVFFSSAVGDDYEIDIDGRVLSGKVLARDLLSFERGALVEVATGDAVLTRRGGGPWRYGPPRRPLLTPRAPAARARPPGPILPELDPVQQRAADLPAGRALLVLGEAGCGKTTVALYRLASLRAAAQEAGRRFRALVVLPTEGLRRLSEALLDRLGAADTEVAVFDRWAGAQARRAFPKLPIRESTNPPPAAIRLKRHPSLRTALDDIARRRPAAGRARGVGATRADLLHLFGDRALLDRLAEATAMSPTMMGAVFEHTRVQFSKTAEEELAGVDAERLVTVDGLSIDERTPMEDAGTIDPEDYPILFALDRRRAAARGTPPAALPAYDCIFLDEAQEFAPLELELVGRTLAPGGTLIVAGDAHQQVDPTAYFAGWKATMAELGVGEYEAVTLDVSYRCPPAVSALARALLGSGRPPPEDPAISLLQADNECHLLVRLADALRELRSSDPNATAVVIYRTGRAAERAARLLGRGVEVNLALHGEFLFTAGIDVTEVQEAKGLEFDYVIVPDVGAGVYPEGGEARRALYVAVTRPVHQLVLGCVGSFSPVLAGAQG